MTEQIERRRAPQLTEDQIEQIVERAINKLADDKFVDKIADRAVEKLESKLYQSVGKTFINRLCQVVGVVLVGAAYYLHSKGFLHIDGK